MSRNGSRYHRLLNTARWRSIRAAVISSQPFCADCALEGLLVPTEEVHHIVPVDEGATPEVMTALAYDRANMVGLCHDCHVRRHKEMRSHRKGLAAERASRQAKAFWERFGGDAGAESPGGNFEEAGGVD